MRAEEFDAHPELGDALRFVMIRDLRDTLVSLYFSLKVSHPLDAEGKRQRERETLESLNSEDGLLHVIETQLAGVAELQRSWLRRNELFYRYEDLLPRDYTLLAGVAHGALSPADHGEGASRRVEQIQLSVAVRP